MAWVAQWYRCVMFNAQTCHKCCLAFVLTNPNAIHFGVKHLFLFIPDLPRCKTRMVFCNSSSGKWRITSLLHTKWNMFHIGVVLKIEDFEGRSYIQVNMVQGHFFLQLSVATSSYHIYHVNAFYWTGIAMESDKL